jgi:hypothetical protein
MAARDSAPEAGKRIGHSAESGIDPTLVRNQPALTSANGSSWLIVGGLFAAICSLVLGFLVPLHPAGLALYSLIAIVLLFAGMVVVRFCVTAQRIRLGWLAALMLTMAVIAVATTIIVSAAEWNLL